MSEKPDEELVKEAQNGDSLSQEELLRRYKYMVVKSTRPYYIVGAEQDDLIQEGMLGLYRAILNYDISGGAKFITYAYQCVKSSIVDAVKSATAKKHRWVNNYLDNGGLGNENGTAYSPEIIAEEMEGNEELISKIKQCLSKREYIVFNLFISGNSITDIAELTRVSYKSVENSLQRIRAKIREILSCRG